MPRTAGFYLSRLPSRPPFVMGELVTYRGYRVVVTDREFRVLAPNGDRAVFHSMSSVRSWVRKHRGAGG